MAEEDAASQLAAAAAAALSEAAAPSEGGSKRDMEGSFALSRQAHLKVLLHAAKYPWASVNGLLIGVADASTGSVSIVDAVPLLHSVVLAPVLETSVVLVEEYCKTGQTDATSIVGWYHGASRENASGVPKVVAKIANRIRAKNAKTATCLVMVDNKGLADESKPGVSVCAKKGDDWLPAVKCTMDLAHTAELTSLLRAGAEKEIVDMECWLQDTTLDWRNPNVV